MEDRPTIPRLLGVVRKNPGFRRLFAANAVSQMGDWFNVVALFSLLLELTGKGEAVAVVLLARLLPIFFVGPAAGVLADRISRRAILVTTDLLRAGLVLCLLFVRHPDQVWIAYSVMIAHALCTAFFEPAQQATYPNLVPTEDLVLAGTLENSLWSATLAIGSSAAGAVLAFFGRDAAFVCDAASFLASALLLRGLPVGRAKRIDAQALQSAVEAQAPNSVGWINLLGLADLREGARYVARHARVRSLLIAKSCFGLTLGGVLVLLAVFGERVFAHGGGAGIATLWTARGIGSFLGPFVAFRLAGHDERGLRRGILWSFLALVVCYSGFAASPGLWSAAGFLAVANAAGSTLWTYGSALLQQIVPDEVRGRVAATEMGGMVLTMSSSTWLVGHLLDRGIGPRTLMAACGLVALVPAAFWASVQGAFRREEPRDTAAA
jgi:predicted MFS family arabinose efflux permease